MKKVLAVVLALTLLVFCFAACSKVTECESCGRETKCKQVEVAGEKSWLCPTCQELAEALVDLEDAVSDGAQDALDELGDLFE